MKNFTAILALWLLMGSGESAAREHVRLDLGGTFLSRFVWRGEMWTDDPVYWQTVTLRYGGFRSYNFFNIDLTDINHDRYECNEYDYILDYTFSFDHFSLAPGMLQFTSPTDFFETTTKITLAVKTDLPFSPCLRIRIDPEKSRGSYYILSFDRTISFYHPACADTRVNPYKKPLREISLYCALGASQPRYYRKYLGDRVKLTDALIGINAPFSLGGGFTISPLIEFTSLLESSVRKAQEANHARKDAVTFGVTLSRPLEF